ncbi:MAG: DUF4406 domain-containing protein [bacterium]
MKIYIAGKITGNQNYKSDFQMAEDYFRDHGHIVMNPAILPEGMNPEQYMQICIPMIFAAEWVAFLPGWETSEGAKLEYELCCYIGKCTFFLVNSTVFMGKWGNLHET